MAVSIYIPTKSARVFPLLHILSSIYCLQTFWWWPFWLVWGDHCSFDLHFSDREAWRAAIHGVAKSWTRLRDWTELNNERCWTSFHVFVKSSVGLLWRNVCLGLFPTFWLGSLFFWYWVVRATRNILEINPLSVVSFAIIFSHSKGCLFTLLIVSFAVQKVLSLIRSYLSTSVFISITLGGGS